MTTTISTLSKGHVLPIYYRILSKFPQNFAFCFAYGSGVKKQTGYNISSKKENMVDLIFCVDNSYRWHSANLIINPDHYSGIKKFGHKFIARFQEQFGARVYFNTLIPYEEQNLSILIKYGVISQKDLVTDLMDWSDLYLAGRLHKPVEIIKETTNYQLQTALKVNLQSAVHSALLILPESFTEYDFYYTISNLSYAGDFRMTFGENKKKVSNIVEPQLEAFRNLYKPAVTLLNDFVDFPNSNKHVLCKQDTNPLTKLHHLNQLPKYPLKGIVRFWNKGNLRQDTEDVLRAVAYDPDCGEILQNSLKDIVWRSSVQQSLKSIATAGFVKSVKYSTKKIIKMFD